VPRQGWGGVPVTPPDLTGADLVRQTARGVLAMRDFHRGGYALPYPPDAQLALDRIVLACLRKGREPPVGVPDLMRLCALPFGKWPIDISEDCGGPGAVLINPDTWQPNRACVEWAVSGLHTGSDETTSSALLRLVMDNHSVWAACRDFLIEHPVIDLHAGPGFLARPAMKQIWQYVQGLYVDCRPELRCPSCGLFASKGNDGVGWCESQSCDAFPLEQGRVDKDVKALSQEIRLSLVLAGRAERTLCASLVSMGTEVRISSEPFAHALATLPSGATWALVVRADTQPVLLAETVRSWAALPGVDRMVVAVPEAVMRRRADYNAVFDRHNTGRDWTLLSTRRLLTEANRTVRKVKLDA
jgi:pPIWI_RE three-gene island domain Y/REase associating with pPIWI_RE